MAKIGDADGTGLIGFAALAILEGKDLMQSESRTRRARRIAEKRAKLLRRRIIPATSALTASALTATGVAAAAGPTSAESAAEILNDRGTVLLDSHVGGENHPASTAFRNIADTAEGRAATTSPWSDVGETTVQLSATMLDGMKQMGADFDFRVTSVAGDDHKSDSSHYPGAAFDVDLVNGQEVDLNTPLPKEFMSKCRSLGAVEVLGPGDPEHDTHVHCAWPH